MKTRLFAIITPLLLVSQAFAADDPNAGVFAGAKGITAEKLKAGNISFSDIPSMIQAVTSFLLGFSATISMIMIIVGGLKLSLGSLEQNKK